MRADPDENRMREDEILRVLDSGDTPLFVLPYQDLFALLSVLQEEGLQVDLMDAAANWQPYGDPQMPVASDLKTALNSAPAA